LPVTLAFSALCAAVEERPDGRIDLVGVFHELHAPGFPAVQARMTAVFTLVWDDGESGRQPIRADLVDAAGNRVLTIQGHTDVPPAGDRSAPPTTRLVMPLEQVVFPAAGRYAFHVVAGAETKLACSLYVLPGPA
jgi:hypothetical protein